MEIMNSEGITQDELTASVNLDKSATTRVVKSLEEKGLISREEDLHDRRMKRLYGTAKGKALVIPLREVLMGYSDSFTRSLSDEKYDELIGMLQTLKEDFELRRAETQ